MNSKTKRIVDWFKNLKTSHKMMLLLVAVLILTTGAAMCATCG